MRSAAERPARSPGVLLLIGECALVLACLHSQFPRLWAERWVQDDAYVSFRYARNLVRGAGLVYNVGQPVEGYTNFLWTILAAVPLAGGAADPLPFMHLVSALLWWATYALLLVIAIRLWGDGIWAAPLGLLPLALHWSFNMWFFSGMETPLVTVLTVAAVAAATADPRRHWWAPTVLSSCVVALMMTRPDGVVVFAALIAAVLGLDGGWILRERRWVQCLLLPAVPVLAVWLPYELWRVWYYGSFFPNTYYAKLAYLPYYGRGWLYLQTYADLYGLVPFTAVALVGAALAPSGSVANRYLTTSLLAAAAVALYVVRLGGDFMEWRFVTPVSAVFYLAVVVGAAVIAERIAWRFGRARARLAAAVGGAVVAAAFASVTRQAAPRAQTYSMPDQETIGLLRRYTDPGRFDWRRAGEVCAAVLPEGARIATTSAGIIPYLCDRPCLDLHGLTDPLIAHMPMPEGMRGRMGHEHWLQDYGQMRERGVDVVVEWANPNVYPHAVARAPEDGRETVSARLPDGRFIDFTVLSPAVMEAMRRRSSDLVFFDRTKVADRTRFHTVDTVDGPLGDGVVVDSLDWVNEASEQAHAFTAGSSGEGPAIGSFHTKLLRYLEPHDDLQLEDDGSRLDGWAEWQVGNVSAARDLVLIARHDYTGAARYALTVNGRPVPDLLATPGRPDEWWGETAVRIPKALLVDGTNTIRITRQPDSEREAEWYYMWFVQGDEKNVTGDQ